jgi:hypothetical protein
MRTGARSGDTSGRRSDRDWREGIYTRGVWWRYGVVDCGGQTEFGETVCTHEGSGEGLVDGRDQTEIGEKVCTHEVSGEGLLDGGDQIGDKECTHEG